MQDKNNEIVLVNTSIEFATNGKQLEYEWLKGNISDIASYVKENLQITIMRPSVYQKAPEACL